MNMAAGRRGASERRRVAIASVAAGIWGGVLAALFVTRGAYLDFVAWWFGAKVWLAGENPYDVIPDMPPFNVYDQLMYPFTAVLATTPFAVLPYGTALTLFFALGSALFGHAVARHATHLWPAFLGFPFVMSAQLGHWSPYLLAALLVPALGFLVAVKPNVGLAIMAARTTRQLVVGASLLVIVSLAVWPTWPWSWVGNFGAYPHFIPAFSFLGAPLLLAALRWREPRARLLLAMAVLPGSATFADQLVIATVARTTRESLVLAMISLIGGVAWALRMRTTTEPSPIVGIPYVICSIYYPALVLVLMHRQKHPDVLVKNVAAN